MDELVRQIQSGSAAHALAAMLTGLSERLKHTSGKIQYGYLRPEVKRLVDEIVAKLAADPNVAEMYEHWRELNGEVRKLYNSKEAEQIPLTDEKTFRSIKNMVIQYALNFNAPENVRRERQIKTGTPLLLALARLLRDDYRQQQRTYERFADRKLMRKIRRKQQDLGQKFDM
jgi:hypothetical protein